MKSKKTESELLDGRGAAPVIGTTPGMLAIMRHRGEGPKYILVNTSVRYRRQDLEAWLAERTVDPKTGVPAHIHARRGGPGRTHAGPMSGPASKERRARRSA